MQSTNQERSEPGGSMAKGKKPVYVPGADIFESATGVTLCLDLPGVSESRLEILVDREILTIKGEMVSQVGEGYTLVHREYDPGVFRRQFRLSDELDRESIDAELKDGTLMVRLSKMEKAASHEVKRERIVD
jgi:HSP20 family molecular chaperone IbpA